MSLLDMAKSALGETSSKIQMFEAVSSLLGAEGGVKNLVQQFESHGLSGVFQSWVSQGANLPVTAEQIEKVFGAERVQALSAKIGMTPQEISQKLSAALPEIVNKLTPEGKLDTTKFTAGSILDLGKSLIAHH